MNNLMIPQQLPYRVEFTGDDDNPAWVITSRKEFGLNFKDARDYLNGNLPPRLVDLLRLGETIYVVDRLLHRGKGPSRCWHRDPRVSVELLDPSFWTNPEVLDSIQDAVNFVSGDFWDFEFVSGSSQYEWTRPLFSNASGPESPLVCLYSGGLDSAAGLSLRVRQCPDRPIIPVTIKHQHRQNKRIKKQYRLLEGRLGAHIEPFVVRMRMNRPAGVKWAKQERSQRGRSVLFTAAGGVAGILGGQSSIEVFESGIGSINIPLMANMVGSRATRSCHPEFLRLMSRLISLVANREITFRLPFFTQTKGEMVRALNELELADLALETISCVGYPLGYQCYKPCGICPACVFRRQAFHVGGIKEPQDTYTYDFFGDADQVNRIPPEKLDYLKAFLMQVSGWADIENFGGLPEPVERHLHATQILKPGDSPQGIIDLLVRNRDEWVQMAAEGRERGYGWAWLLAPAQFAVESGAFHASD
jgi:7-cyano-7-deazaguanine synthase in queuosine biosynthesis